MSDSYRTKYTKRLGLLNILLKQQLSCELTVWPVKILTFSLLDTMQLMEV